MQKRATTANAENKDPPKRKRDRALPSPNAIAYTLPDYQAIGGPGKTAIYELARKGKLKLFKDRIGRTMVDGESGRELLRGEPWIPGEPVAKSAQ